MTIEDVLSGTRSWHIEQTGALEGLRALPDGCVQCVVTSPPYWGLRNYGVDGQMGLESTPSEYIERMTEVFHDVKGVLRPDGVMFLNLGDSYAGSGKGQMGDGAHHSNPTDKQATNKGTIVAHLPVMGRQGQPFSLPAKSLMGMPWRLAFALQDDGWILRSDIIWSKPAPMPESVTDRPTRSHEYIFLFAKQGRYFYDAAAIAEQSIFAGKQLGLVRGQKRRAMAMGVAPHGNEGPGADAYIGRTRNVRSVWTIGPEPFPLGHFATFPPSLPERCIKAGNREGDIILDPFAGAGTTIMVACRLGRRGIGLELSPAYAAMARHRIAEDAPMFNRQETVI